MRRVGIGVLLAAVGCFTSEAVTLERRSDGAQAQCGGKRIAWPLLVLPPIGVPWAGATMIETRTCVVDFQRAGYERTSNFRGEAVKAGPRGE
jgi:hypothetical protein